MAAVPATRELLAIAFSSYGAYISVHTADPGTTGGSEAAGGAPAYARKQTTWTPGASDGVVTGSAVTVDVPAGTFAWAGLWSAATGGTFVDKIAITSTTFGAAGQLVVTPTVTVT